MKKLTAEEFDQLADSGKDMSEYLDWDKATRGDTKRINIDMPIEFLTALDQEAIRRGITRQSLIKVWLYDRLFPTSGIGVTYSTGVIRTNSPVILSENVYKVTEETVKNR